MKVEQLLGCAFYGVAYMSVEMIEDIEKGGDGSNLSIQIDMPIYEIKNGKLFQTEANDNTDEENIKSMTLTTFAGLSAETGGGILINLVTGITIKSLIKK